MVTRQERREVIEDRRARRAGERVMDVELPFGQLRGARVVGGRGPEEPEVEGPRPVLQLLEDRPVLRFRERRHEIADEHAEAGRREYRPNRRAPRRRRTPRPARGTGR